MPVSLNDLRRFAIRRSLFGPTTLKRAIERLGFVQADPIRAPARAQDLILFQRVKGYHAGDLELRYVELGVEEDLFVNYGFLTRQLHGLMHPRAGLEKLAPARARQAEEILAFVRERGEVHPREVEARFSAGTERNYWGGSSNATTRLLDQLHYRGLLRVARRESGVRVYAPARGAVEPVLQSPGIDALVDLAVRKYAPLPSSSLWDLIRRLRHAAPQWRGDLKAAFQRAADRLAHAHVAGVDWYWPEAERAGAASASGRSLETVGDVGRVRLLSPFDPVVWDRRRFELFWGWAYRFEAYTPLPKRKLGYYALPVLWRERVIGWANLTLADGQLAAALGYVSGKAPRGAAYRLALEAELARFEAFLRPRASRRFIPARVPSRARQGSR